MYALHSELILHRFKHYLVAPLPRVCEWNLCHEIARASLFACVCECVKFYLRYLLPPHFVFYAKFLLACSTCLLCTTLFLLLFLTIILRPIICSYETKFNFSSLFFFCFHQVRRLLLLSCFPFLSAACHVYRWRHATLSDWERVCLFVCVLVSSRAYFDARRGCLRVWVRLLK